MTALYRMELDVAESALDRNQHVNNVVFVQWMQDVAVRHAKDLGLTRELYESWQVTWFARSHHIDYLSQAKLHDRLEIRTWIARAAKASCLRRYEFWLPAESRVLAKAETEWVMVSTKTGRPTRIPSEIIERFSVYDPAAS